MNTRYRKTIYPLITLISLFSPSLFAETAPEAGQKTQTLDFVVCKTLNTHPKVLERKAYVKEAKATFDQARGEFLPQIDFYITNGREETKKSYIDNKTVRLHRTENRVFLTQPVFSGFSSYHSVKQRKLEIKAAKFQENLTKEQLALDATNAYFNLLRLDEIKTLTTQNVKIHQKILNKVTLRYQGGGGNKTDVNLAKGRLSRSESLQDAAKEAYKNATATFIKITGFAPGTLQQPKIPKIPANLDQAKNIAIQNNPALLSTQALKQSTSSLIAATKGRLSPSLDIEVSLNDYHNITGIEGQRKDLRGMLILNYNLFNGGIDIAAVKRAKERHIAAIQHDKDLQREITENVIENWNALITDRLQQQKLENYVSSSKKVLEDYKKQFITGRRSLLDLLDVENELFNAKTALINKEYALKTDHYRLLAHIGQLVKLFP